MKLTVLGSGNAEHHADRACAGYLLEIPEPVLLDFGPGCWRNLARSGIDPGTIRTILISHLHSDHFSDLIPFLFHQAWSTDPGRPTLRIFGPPGTREVLEGVRRSIPLLSAHGFPIEIREDSTGTPFESRRVPHVDYLTAQAWRVQADGRIFAYSGDCRFSDDTIDALGSADLAVVEATFPDGEEHPNHMTLGEACEAATRAGVRRLVLGHLSRKWEGRDPAAEAQDKFKGPVHEARDLLALEV